MKSKNSIRDTIAKGIITAFAIGKPELIKKDAIRSFMITNRITCKMVCGKIQALGGLCFDFGRGSIFVSDFVVNMACAWVNENCDVEKKTMR